MIFGLHVGLVDEIIRIFFIYEKFNQANFKSANGFEVVSISLDGLTDRRGNPKQDNAKETGLLLLWTMDWFGNPTVLIERLGFRGCQTIPC